VSSISQNKADQDRCAESSKQHECVGVELSVHDIPSRVHSNIPPTAHVRTYVQRDAGDGMGVSAVVGKPESVCVSVSVCVRVGGLWEGPEWEWEWEWRPGEVEGLVRALG
jgi:hypothetical protein